MKTFLTFLFLSFICLNQHGFSQYYKYSLKLKLEKNTYYESETITARLKFINNDTVEHTIGGNCSIEDDIINHLNFLIPAGFAYRARFTVIVDCVIDRVIVKPKDEYETFGAAINLNGRYIFSGGDILPIGEYSVFYSGLYGTSDTIPIKVISSEDNKDYLKFLKVKNIINKEERFKVCRNYLNEQESSTYNNYFLDELFSLNEMYNLFDDPYKVLNSDLTKFFGKSPNAWSNDIYVIYFSWYIRNFYTNSKMMDFLRVLIKKYPNTRVEYIAEKILTSNKIPDFVY